MAAQLRNFLDQTGGLWFTGALVGNFAHLGYEPFLDMIAAHGLDIYDD